MGKRVSSINGVEKTGQPQRTKLDQFLTPYMNTNSKWIKGLNIRPETIKFPGKNIGDNR